MVFNMNRRSDGRKKVTWALGGSLCQVMVFGADDSPSKVGALAKNFLKTKMKVDKVGELEHRLPVGCLKKKKPVIAWKCPPRFVYTGFFTVAGESSEEKKAQKQRESRVYEAIYPHPSTIPPSPISPDVDECDYDDSLTPVISMVPIEEVEMTQSGSVNPETQISLGLDSAVLLEDSATCEQLDTSQYDGPASQKQQKQVVPRTSDDAGAGGSASASVPKSKGEGSEAARQSSLNESLSGGGGDVLNSASLTSAILALVKKNEEKGNEIDFEVLIEIFKDPKMVEKLLKNGPSDCLKGLLNPELQTKSRSVSSPNPVFCSTQEPASITPHAQRIAGVEPHSVMSRYSAHGNATSSVQTRYHEFPFSSAFQHLSSICAFPSPPQSCTQLPLLLSQRPAYVNAGIHQMPMIENADNFQNRVIPALDVLSSPSRSVFSSRASSYMNTNTPKSLMPDYENSPLPRSQYKAEPNNTFSVPKTSTSFDWLSHGRADNMVPGLVNSNPSKYLSDQVMPARGEWTELPKGVSNLALGRIMPQELQHGLLSSSILPNMGSPSSVKDMDYFKNLIKEHGKETVQTAQQERKLNEIVKQKPSCKFFNTPKGCRKGLNCTFKHDRSTNLGAELGSKFQVSKKMRFTV